MQYVEGKTRQQHRADMKEMCRKEFEEHVLERESEDRWYCGKPGTGFYHFRVIFSPGYVIVVGDIGDVVLRCGYEPLGWILGSNDPDYILGKSQIRGDHERLFFPQEALDYLQERIEEERIEPDEEEPEELDAVDEAVALAELARPRPLPPTWEEKFQAWRKRIRVEGVSEECPDEALGSYQLLLRRYEDALRWCDEPDRTWFELWDEIVGDGDPPRCQDWDYSMLRCYHALMTFRRLHQAQRPQAEPEKTP